MGVMGVRECTEEKGVVIVHVRASVDDRQQNTPADYVHAWLDGHVAP